jgi:hypothetical protein
MWRSFEYIMQTTKMGGGDKPPSMPLPAPKPGEIADHGRSYGPTFFADSGANQRSGPGAARDR